MPWKSWICADDVLKQLPNSIDLVASDAIYHGQCESIFLRKNVYLQQRALKLNTWPNRQHNEIKFWKIRQMVDEQTELFAVNELHGKMCLFAQNI